MPVASTRSSTAEFFGKYRGVVKSNQDPLGRGRLQVIVPQVLENSPAWAMPCVPYAGKERGFFAMPDVGTGVWVEFEAGNPSFPIWTGCFWNKDDIPRADSVPEIKFFKTKKIHAPHRRYGGRDHDRERGRLADRHRRARYHPQELEREDGSDRGEEDRAQRRELLGERRRAGGALMSGFTIDLPAQIQAGAPGWRCWARTLA